MKQITFITIWFRNYSNLFSVLSWNVIKKVPTICMVITMVLCNRICILPFVIIIIIIICQVYCRHRRSWPSNPLCRQFFWWAHCWAILFLLRNYSDCLCILFVVFLCFWYHKPFSAFGTTNLFTQYFFFFSPSAQFICPKFCSSLFLTHLKNTNPCDSVSFVVIFIFFLVIITILLSNSWSPSSVSCVATRKIVRRSVLGPVRDIT